MNRSKTKFYNVTAAIQLKTITMEVGVTAQDTQKKDNADVLGFTQMINGY